jgi:hypothetical protein
MVRRGTVVALVLLAVFGTVACDGPYLPPGWRAPVVESFEVSPTPVVAGSAFTVTVAATDDGQVAAMSLYFLGTHPERWDRMRVTCQLNTFEPGPAVTGVFDCTMPSVAPNGTWKVAVTVCDGEVQCQEYGGFGGGGYATTTFDVTGGTDDDRAPTLVSATYNPDPVVVGSPSTLTLQISDDHLRRDLPQQVVVFSGPLIGEHPTQYCFESSRAEVSGTVDQYVFDCPPGTAPGEYRINFAMTDQIGNSFFYGPLVDVVAAP